MYGDRDTATGSPSTTMFRLITLPLLLYTYCTTPTVLEYTSLGMVEYSRVPVLSNSNTVSGIYICILILLDGSRSNPG